MDIRRLFHRASSDERGAAAVEFALVVPIFLVIVFGMVDFTRAYYTQSAIAAAVREGARMASVQKNPVSTASQALVKQRVRTFVVPFGNDAIPLTSITVQMVGTNGTTVCAFVIDETECPNVRVQVSNYNFKYYTPISRIANSGSKTKPITRAAVFRFERNNVGQ
jgi:Flp pilus assembly protein TadG